MDQRENAALIYYQDMSSVNEVAHAAFVAIQILMADTFLVGSWQKDFNGQYSNSDVSDLSLLHRLGEKMVAVLCFFVNVLAFLTRHLGTLLLYPQSWSSEPQVRAYGPLG
jgi:hypothetical protein